MNRRGFLSALACLPGLAFLKPEEEVEPIQYLRGDPLWDLTEEGEAWRQAVTEAANDRTVRPGLKYVFPNGSVIDIHRSGSTAPSQSTFVTGERIDLEGWSLLDKETS